MGRPTGQEFSKGRARLRVGVARRPTGLRARGRRRCWRSEARGRRGSGRSEASRSPESGGGKARGAETASACRGRGRAEARRRAGARGLAKRPCSLPRPGSAQGPGAHRRPETSSPASAILFSREESAGPSLARPGSPGLTILLGERRWRRAAAVGSAGRGDGGWLSGAGWGATGPGPGARRAESGLERRRRVERVAASLTHTDGPDSLQRLAADRNLKARNRARRGRSERGAGRGGACGRPTSGNPLPAVPTLSNRSAPRAARYPPSAPRACYVRCAGAETDVLTSAEARFL